MPNHSVAGDQLPGKVDGVALEVVAEAEVAQHLEEGVVAAGEADIFKVVVLAAGADALLRSGGAGVVAASPRPRNRSLNWFMPALVNSSVGSLAGTSEEECTRRCPFDLKKAQKQLADFVSRAELHDSFSVTGTIRCRNLPGAYVARFARLVQKVCILG